MRTLLWENSLHFYVQTGLHCRMYFSLGLQATKLEATSPKHPIWGPLRRAHGQECNVRPQTCASVRDSNLDDHYGWQNAEFSGTFSPCLA